MQTYRHSGAIPIEGGFLSVMLGLGAALVGGFAYAYAFRWIPFVYLNFLVTLLFAALIGGSVYYGGHIGKVRNTPFSVVVGLLCTLFGMWVYWGAYAWALGGVDLGLRAWSPGFLLAFGQELFQNGSWGITSDTPVTGWVLVGLWVVELFVVSVVAIIAAALDSDTAFCEHCLKWTESEKGVAQLDADGAEPAWVQITAGDLVGLAEFQPAPSGSQRFVRLDLASCPQCTGSRFLTIKRVEITHDKKGNPKENETPLVTNAILKPEHEEIVRLCGALARGEFSVGTEGEKSEADPGDTAAADEDNRVNPPTS
jgi:hypothetical protein